MHECEKKNVLFRFLLLLPRSKEHKPDKGKKPEEGEDDNQFDSKRHESDEADQGFKQRDNESDDDQETSNNWRGLYEHKHNSNSY